MRKRRIIHTRNTTVANKKKHKNIKDCFPFIVRWNYYEFSPSLINSQQFILLLWLIFFSENVLWVPQSSLNDTIIRYFSYKCLLFFSVSFVVVVVGFSSILKVKFGDPIRIYIRPLSLHLLALTNE